MDMRMDMCIVVCMGMRVADVAYRPWLRGAKEAVCLAANQSEQSRGVSIRMNIHVYTHVHAHTIDMSLQMSVGTHVYAHVFANAHATCLLYSTAPVHTAHPPRFLRPTFQLSA